MVTPLLLVYHASYDAIALIMLPIAMMAIAPPFQPVNGISLRFWNAAWSGTIVILGIQLLPRFLMARIWPSWDNLYAILSAASTLLAWLLTLVLLWQTTDFTRADELA